MIAEAMKTMDQRIAEHRRSRTTGRPDLSTLAGCLEDLGHRVPGKSKSGK